VPYLVRTRAKTHSWERRYAYRVMWSRECVLVSAQGMDRTSRRLAIMKTKRGPDDYCGPFALRREKRLSQGEIEKKTGLLRCYISRVENGHTVPTIETLEKMAPAFEVPLYQLFYEGTERTMALAQKILKTPHKAGPRR
jgi:DNA-binding XRE family transcriptional regulator